MQTMMKSDVFTFVTIPDNCVQAISEFVNSYNYSEYAKRHQDNLTKAKKDNVTGKLGEWVAWKTLKELFGGEVTTPDMEIYDVKDKNWTPDLTMGKAQFIVKSRDVESAKYGFPQSWVFQYRNSDGAGGQDNEVFSPPFENKFVVLVDTDRSIKGGMVRNIIPLAKLHKFDLFGEPQKESLIGIKKVVYAMSLKCNDNMWDQYPEELKSYV